MINSCYHIISSYYILYIPLRSDITDKFNNFTLFGVYALYPTTFRYNLYKFFKLWVFCFVLYIPLRSDITSVRVLLYLFFNRLYIPLRSDITSCVLFPLKFFYFFLPLISVLYYILYLY